MSKWSMCVVLVGMDQGKSLVCSLIPAEQRVQGQVRARSTNSYGTW